MILLPNVAAKEAQECAQRIRRGVEQLSADVADGLTLRVTVSLGLAGVDIAAHVAWKVW